jgi:molybdopterin molybdotransferase
MRVAETFERRPGRTEFTPARVVADGDGKAIEILARGGSARLRPLSLADGLAEIEPLHAPVEAGSQIGFHPFGSGFVP